MAENNTPKKQRKEVFAVIERGERTFWTRIGAAFENKDGSYNLLLDLVPTDPKTTINIRDPKPDSDD